MGRGGNTIAAIFAIGLVAVLATGFATAALKSKSASTTIGQDEVGSIAAKCKKGTKAISGGFDAEFGEMLDPFVLPFASQKRGGRKWESAAGNFGDSGSLTSFAYCRDEKLKRRSSETTVEGDLEIGTATAKCPKGTKAISGGFDSLPDFEIGKGSSLTVPFESRRSSKRGWTVSARNFGDDPRTLVAQVVCHEGKGLATAEGTVFATEAGIWTAVATCQPGSRVLSGGFDTTLAPQGDGDGPWAISSHKQGRRSWEVSYADFEAEATFTAFAYCEKKR